jgi:zinc transport system substrate-binding protein
LGEGFVRKTVIFLAGLSLFLGGITSPHPLSARDPVKSWKVVCTILPIYVLTLNVVGQIPGVEVKLLLPPHQGCPHDYDLTPSDLIKLSQADLIVANGLGLEEFVEKTLRRSKFQARVFLAAEKVKPIWNRPGPKPLHGKEHQEEGNHPHEGPINGHAWVSPEAAAIMARTIADGLALQDSIHSQEYHFQAEQYGKRLENLAREMKAVVSQAKNKKCLAFHDSLAYLARDIGLTLIGVVESYPGLEPSPKEMAHLIKSLKEQQAAAIFSEPQYSDKIVKTLSKASGVPFFELDPVATGKPAADTYEKAMRKNLEVLRKAVK